MLCAWAPILLTLLEKRRPCIFRQVFSSTDQERPHQDRANFLGSLRMVRSGAIHQGVFTSGSLTDDAHSRVDAFVDRWHCRRSAQRSGRILAAVLEHLAESVRWVLSTKRADGCTSRRSHSHKIELTLKHKAFESVKGGNSSNVPKTEQLTRETNSAPFRNHASLIY